MSLKLILMRHAKSGWDDPTQDDFDRPLSERGRRQAPLLGQWLADRGHVPDVAFVSAAKRTRETWDLVSEALPGTRVEYRDNLYLAAPRTLITAPRDSGAECALVLAHNPGIAQAAQDLVDQRPSDGEFLRYPTCATAVIGFEAEDWDSIKRGRLLDFTVPRRLE